MELREPALEREHARPACAERERGLDDLRSEDPAHARVAGPRFRRQLDPDRAGNAGRDSPGPTPHEPAVAKDAHADGAGAGRNEPRAQSQRAADRRERRQARPQLRPERNRPRLRAQGAEADVVGARRAQEDAGAEAAVRSDPRGGDVRPAAVDLDARTAACRPQRPAQGGRAAEVRHARGGQGERPARDDDLNLRLRGLARRARRRHRRGEAAGRVDVGDERAGCRGAVAEIPGVARRVAARTERHPERRDAARRRRDGGDGGWRSGRRSREGETGEQDDRAAHRIDNSGTVRGTAIRETAARPSRSR